MNWPSAIDALQYSLAAQQARRQASQSFADQVQPVIGSLLQRSWDKKDYQTQRKDAGFDTMRQSAAERYLALNNPDMVEAIYNADSPEAWEKIRPMVMAGWGQETQDEERDKLRFDWERRQAPDEGGLTPKDRATLAAEEEEARLRQQNEDAKRSWDMWQFFLKRGDALSAQRWKEDYQNRLANVAERGVGLREEQDRRGAMAAAVQEQLRLEAEARAKDLHPLQKEALQTLINARKEDLSPDSKRAKAIQSAIRILASMGREGGGTTIDQRRGIIQTGGGSRPIYSDEIAGLARELGDILGIPLDLSGSGGGLGGDPGGDPDINEEWPTLGDDED